MDLALGDLPVRAMSLLDPAHLSALGGIAINVYPPDGALGRLPPRRDTLWLVGTDATGEAVDSVRAAMERLGPSVVVDLASGTGAERLDRVSLDETPCVVRLAEYGPEVGLLDLDRADGGGWLVSWHTVPLAERWEHVPSPAREEISRLFDVYREEVRRRGLLDRFPTVPDAPGDGYVGSARCAACHRAIYDSWAGTAHHGALADLEAKGYAWDPECARCHVVGFERLPGGRFARAASGFLDPERTPYLGGVGCESCHGPGRRHVSRPTDPAVFQGGGPMRRDPGRRRCETCHDVQNSHRFPEHYEDEYRPAVDHHRVPSDRRTTPAR